MNFINQLAHLSWVLHSNMAQAIVKAINDDQEDSDIVDGISSMLFLAVYGAIQLREFLRGIGGTWRPSKSYYSSRFHILILLSRYFSFLESVPKKQTDLDILGAGHAQMTRIFYREAMGCRLVGGIEYLERRTCSIAAEMRLIPHVAAFEEEQSNIAL